MTCRLVLLATLWSLAAVPAHAFQASGEAAATGTVSFAFTPDGDAAALVIKAIDGARHQVLVQAFSFTHSDIARALVRAHRRGIDVRVIADPEQIELIRHNVVGMVAAAGVPVFTDAAHAAAHDKVMVVDVEGDRPAVVTGSFNFTHAAQYRNAENVLVLSGNRPLAQAYRDNWNRHRAHATPWRRYGH
jgi:phosphatidylserine/phosphatidylglycerophosphate/cardiolipin synthase-like enzyme